jgi:hypothetical protein
MFSQKGLKQRIIKSQYSHLKETWDIERALRLCELINISLEELSQFLNIPFKGFKTRLLSKKLNGSTYVLLDLWERYAYISKGLTPDAAEKVNPIDYDRLRDT